MLTLALGFSLWSATHFLPSALPGLREWLIDAIGPQAYRGAFSLIVALSLVLIVWGFRAAPFIPVYDPPAWGIHVNNVLMLFAVYLFGVGGAKGWLATKIRHPMLTGALVWSAAHLLANGDQASILLFGGMALWAIGMIWMINRRVGAWAPRKSAGTAAEIRLVLITILIYAVIAFTHGWLLGVRPFPG
ncbi:NnrU family protein [Pikeienuella piscinae]|uniref:NnrU family protein n=1 Tax=Pikeienuella piscinae TaxID=2748098 RepID=A0A7L5BY27_9RHOB|nr:NnrU family protein [Pikeienuella piscinae]QIE56825.1 NnrU family protein [Pikeienuella piscinae]